jgi:hypothetical protein
MLSMITPTVMIDGYAMPASYGANTYPVNPGTHVVSCHGQWLWKYGQAQQQITVADYQTAELWYNPPA